MFVIPTLAHCSRSISCVVFLRLPPFTKVRTITTSAIHSGSFIRLAFLYVQANLRTFYFALCKRTLHCRFILACQILPGRAKLSVFKPSKSKLWSYMRFSPPEFHLRMPKRVLYSFVTNTTRTFGHLSCTDYEHFWNKDMNRCAHA